MLFNSYIFVFAFLPVTLVGYVLLSRLGFASLLIVWLLAASLVFYGWWNPPYLLLMIASITFNYLASVAVIRLQDQQAQKKTILLITTAAIILDLGLLGYFKYTNFFIDNLNKLTGLSLVFHKVFLPLAISFHTIQQIAYLMDVYRGKVRRCSFLRYCLFVMFFPQLIAGPIVRHEEMMHQFGRKLSKRFGYDMVVGITIFTAGLFKKVVLADGVSVYSNYAFNAAAAGASPTFFEAWGGAMAYTLQIYFDFSAYSDMAIGLARMFGIKLPLNFDAPYKSTSIIDFWRRWHMTLSRFLRDYVYIGLGGNRKGQSRRYINMMATMLIGGLWHGAGWTFVVWGGLHGLYLAINHGWRALRGQGAVPSSRISDLTSRGLTFFCVVVAWVFFRATDWSTAARMIKGMSGLNGISLPRSLESHLGFLGWAHIRFEGLGSLETGGTFVAFAWVIGLLGVVWLLPATHQWLARGNPTIEKVSRTTRWLWRPSVAWAAVTGTMMAIALVGMLSRSTEFIYFQF